ncbi:MULTISPECIES: hypothetical protein [Delftia]|uniref:hypothetical protein n=1 Tax=Delftia TaxID=80865 RepID=UPI000F845530|nr:MULTISPECIES: hypothetical protein [Delftia]WEM00052.1 hypothetical protein PW274_07140 [Delftia tsuruhatensis]
MTTAPTPDLRALAEAAEGNGEHIYTHPRDSNKWRENEAWHRAASPGAVLHLLDRIHELEMQVLDLASENSILKRAETDELEARKPLPLSDEQIDAIADGMPGGLGGFLKTWGWRQFARKILESSDVPNAPSLLPLAGKLADAARQVVGGDVLTVGRVAPADVYCLGELCKRLRDAVDEYDAAIIESAKDKP